MKLSLMFCKFKPIIFISKMLDLILSGVYRHPAAHFLIILLVATFPMLLYGNNLLSPVSLDLQTEPFNFWNTVFYSWQSKQFLGGAINAQGWLFPSATFFSLFSFLDFPSSVTVRIWYVAILLTAGITMYYYATWIFQSYELRCCDVSTNTLVGNDRTIKLCSLVAAIGYMANPYVVLHCLNGHFLIPYAVLPLQLLILDKGLISGKLYYAVLLGLLSVMVTTNLPLVVLSYALICAYIGYFVVFVDRGLSLKVIRFVVVFFTVTALNLLWFILPTAINFINADASMAAAQAQETWQMYGQNSSLLETFRLLGVWAIYGYGYEFSDYYINNFIGIFATFLIPIIAITSLIYIGKSRLLIFILLIYTVSVFMAVGGHALNPFRDLYIYFYDHVPLFSMFRNGYKFVGAMAFAYVLIITMGLYKWMNNKSSNKSTFAAIFVMLIFIASALPLFRGQLFANNQLAKVPMYWKDVANFLDDKHSLFRVMLLPDQYFETYKWGGYAGFISSAPYISQDVIANGGIKEGNELIQMLYKPFINLEKSNTFSSDKSVSNSEFCELLVSMSVRYVLQRNDIDISIYHVASQSKMREKLGAINCISKVQSFNAVDIYEVTMPVLPRIYSSQ